MSKLVVASLMVCKIPRVLGGRVILSCSDSVCEAVDALPADISNLFSDDVGNVPVEYGGFLQLIDRTALRLLHEHSLFACFRLVEERFLKSLEVCPPQATYSSLGGELVPMGWDIATGNGWVSASFHGEYPIDPFTGMQKNENADQINQFGLFESKENCQAYCEINNREIPEHSLWFPVLISVDRWTAHRFQSMLNLE